MRYLSILFNLFACAVVVAAVPGQAATPAQTFSIWEKLRSPDTAAIRFADGERFLREHPAWPEEKIIRLRTEAAAMSEHPPRDAMARFCTDHPPISGRGMLACIEGRVGDNAKRAEWLKQAWLQGDFNEEEEKRILKTYGDKLSRDEHTARMERLLYEAKLPAAKRMLTRISAVQQNLIRVRMALLANEKTAPRLLNTLSAAQQRDTGVLFERLRWRMRKGDDDLTDLLLQAPKAPPFAELWWPMRAAAARDAIGKNNYNQALSLVANPGELKGEPLAEALWLKGWIELQHMHDAATAYKAFFKLYTSVSTPVSKARAAYWAARAAKKNGNDDIAKEWLEKAARHPSVFYGQLAYAQLHPQSPLPLPPAPEASNAERQAFEADERVKTIRFLAADGNEAMRDLFLTSLGLRITNDSQFSLLSELASEVGGIAAGVEAAKLALRSSVVVIAHGWPRIALPPDLNIEPALTLAITRQESEFNANAKSPADARGLMQLLPATAKHIAKKEGIAYSPEMLSDPSTNLTLGSLYLGRIIDGFDGSYMLGIASYNAGPGNVRKWLAARGNPPKTLAGAIDWIEAIPFGETRNYVMRVLENVSIYRTRINEDAPLAIEADLLR